MDKANLNRRVGPIRESLFPLAVLEIHYRGEHSLTQLQGSPRVLRKGTLRMAPGLDTATHQRASRILAPESASGLVCEHLDAELRQHP